MPVQIITTASGEELAVLPRADYERLAAAAGEAAAEDAAASRLVERAMADIASGAEIVLPEEVSDAIARGESPVAVLRHWRGRTQADLAAASGVTQGYLSDIERGRKTGTLPTLRALARELAVPLDILLED